MDQFQSDDQFARAGLNITGLDESTEILKECQKKQQQLLVDSGDASAGDILFKVSAMQKDL